MKQIILNEWKILLRIKVLSYLTIFFIVGLIGVTLLGVIQNNKQKQHQQGAQKEVRQQWEKIDAMNPHGASHYGSYAFKPITALSTV